MTMTNQLHLLAKTQPVITYQFWAGLGHPDQTLDDLIMKMEDLGNEIIAIDEEINRILVGQRDVTEDRYGCTLCLAVGNISICDTREEFGAHLDQCHPGWSVNEKGEPVVE